VNPDLEIRVKKILKDQTGMDVCCGHELSGSLNFTVRATTSVLNAGIMPIMEEFLEEMEIALAEIGISAPLLVVRGDGSVMRETFAKEFPVQTALSGPAASMAGARYLTGLSDALVVDIGGTTSDIGFLENGAVTVRDEGAVIGGWVTHIKAVDMRTAGLGGDSEIYFERGEWKLGPRRIAPVSWLISTLPEVSPTPALAARLEKAAEGCGGGVDTTVPFQFLVRTGKEPDFPMTEREREVMEALSGGPLMISELQESLRQGSWRTIKTARLESTYCLQRCGLTPTDLYHAGDLLSLWNADFAGKYLEFIARVCNTSSSALSKIAGELVDRVLGRVLLEKIIPGGGISLQEQGLRDTILDGGNRVVALRPAIRIPVVGLGAPARLMMKGVMTRLGADWKVPDDGDVANAIGAVTSEVRVVRNAAVSTTTTGGFRISGIEGCSRHFETLEEAEKVCIEELAHSVRGHALRAGTSSVEVRMKISTETASSAEGSELFIQRNFSAEITGPPDLA
jgi:N-methylhydantoinase A/oxoprolinase/acetone carboxylase beta subunit